MDDFDRRFRSVKRKATFGILASPLINGAILGGVGWAVYRIVTWLTA